MDEFDDISEEERAQAEAFARAIDEGTLEEPDAHLIALSQTAEGFEPRKASLAQTRDNVLNWADNAKQAQTSSPKIPPWLAWLPVPALALVSFMLLNTEESARSTAPFESEMAFKEAPLAEAHQERWHEGEIPPQLLQAQAKLLAAKAAKREFDRSEFNREMRNYRTSLLARVEMESSR